jgi:hypothetical protein
MQQEQIKVGDRVLVEEAWEDESGYYHDAFAEVVGIENGEAKLKFEDKRVDEFLKGSDGYKLDELQKV